MELREKLQDVSNEKKHLFCNRNHRKKSFENVIKFISKFSMQRNLYKAIFVIRRIFDLEDGKYKSVDLYTIRIIIKMADLVNKMVVGGSVVLRT